ncbi:hypothetical protein C5B90_06445 [Haloferax sp. Atlit-12N]|uniref:hypothetical protein n=1 Tax=Haloferax sp. Atlit-12N TaxID=2077203 RepID=UPI000E281C9F|nr:hypothetical protein [Haloferax sp. Atlit-12N]RDZ65983.1 hypothetical protein C5B90_06445 [Haloferax sp. Atlit-12N]
MDRESMKISAETTYIRSRGNLKLGIRLLGIAALIIGAHNMMLSEITGTLLFPFYRSLIEGVIFAQGGFMPFADILLMAVGAAVAWFI